VAATLEQVLAAVQAASTKADRANAKLDALLTEMGIVMSLQDDLAAATQTLTDEVTQLNSSYDQLAALVDQLRAAEVDPEVVAGFDAALAGLKPSVDKIAALTTPPPPPA
jgi:outer membrane murein-binding lipoprotein Lpp